MKRMKVNIQLLWFIAVCCAAFVPQQAVAHPHVFVEALVQLEIENGRLKALHETWSFDEMSSALFLGDLDLNQDGALTPDEWEKLKADITGYLHEEGFYTHIYAGGKTAGVTRVEHFTATFSDGMLRYSFTVPLDLPAAAGEVVKVALYDPTYYTAFFFDERHVTVKGADKARVVLQEAPELAYYYGQIVPYAIELEL
ncbi:DUF1007 family protein [Oleidesulfovibrio alaskensis]|uniref:DUF1007 family protein n=1 Tax=Oleidesulfovibrio alaskensis TaxID=58180 RepID=UPI000485DFF6|nr:DUF1007 family protein [Oleidesulfovibrio alaskensis]